MDLGVYLPKRIGSKCKEDVRTHVFHRIVQDIKARNAGTDPDELQAPIDDTVREVRAERASFGRRRAGPGGPAQTWRSAPPIAFPYNTCYAFYGQAIGQS